jgi:predicted nucleotidyltransferase
VDVLAEVRRFFERHGGGVVAVYVFGSVGRGEDRPRIRFEVGRRNEYFDLLPILTEYRRPPGARRQ